MNIVICIVEHVSVTTIIVLWFFPVKWCEKKGVCVNLRRDPSVQTLAGSEVIGKYTGSESDHLSAIFEDFYQKKENVTLRWK